MFERSQEDWHKDAKACPVKMLIHELAPANLATSKSLTPKISLSSQLILVAQLVVRGVNKEVFRCGDPILLDGQQSIWRSHTTSDRNGCQFALSITVIPVASICWSIGPAPRCWEAE